MVRRVEEGGNVRSPSRDAKYLHAHLCERFGRLFELAETKSCSVAEMASLGWGTGGAAWVHSSDRWQWQSDPDKDYSVRGAYHLLTSQDSVTLDAATGYPQKQT
ncbi:hypothetical protein TSUD_58520 [Trifolium subterraneum]|uniref:Uncharacterized protein n=1 Tax=Trifolium subterraneum TaxID=3900 RepID=A0A2Z6M9K3_TRISU|nr:hypothetical protein TSUD_58520 [Trifolium subterraneum]